MSVQFADKALDEWLTKEIIKIEKLVEASTIEVEAHKKGSIGLSWIANGNLERRRGYMYALMATQSQLREFWGASLKPEDE